MKKNYTKPELFVHGDAATLTQGGTCINGDTPSGNSNAYPPPSTGICRP